MSRIHQVGKVVLLGALLATPTLAQEDKDVCGGRPRCEVKGTTAAGKGLEVVELSLGKAQRQDEAGEEPTGCEQQEWWLRRADKSVVKLLDACNDGYGAAGIGEDDVEVKDNRFTHARFGGSSWRWSRQIVLQLSPLSLISMEHSDFRTTTPEATETRFNYTTFEGRVVRKALDCKLELEEVSSDSGTFDVEANLVPQVELPADFVKDGWRRTGLGRCAASSGFTLLGKAQGPKDARIQAVLTPGNVLFLEVTDDTWTGPGEKWLADDHVELWLFEGSLATADPCGREGKDSGLVQWAIRIADGKVFPAHGDPKPPLPVELVREGSLARLKVTLPKDFDGLTAVYSDSDTGKKQELMVATSALKFGRAATLSPVRNLPRTEATCTVKGAELAPAPAELRPAAGEAALPD
jgi:hypothetical protein